VQPRMRARRAPDGSRGVRARRHVVEALADPRLAPRDTRAATDPPRSRGPGPRSVPHRLGGLDRRRAVPQRSLRLRRPARLVPGCAAQARLDAQPRFPAHDVARAAASRAGARAMSEELQEPAATPAPSGPSGARLLLAFVATTIIWGSTWLVISLGNDTL